MRHTLAVSPAAIGGRRDAGDARRRLAHALDEHGQRELPGQHGARVERGEGRLEADRAEGGRLEGHLLLLLRVGRVIGGHAVDQPALERRDERLAVARGAQRRVHLHAGVEGVDGLVGHRQVVRRGLGRHAHAELLGARQVLERERAAHVAEMHAAVLVARHLEGAGHVGALGDGRDAGQAQLRRHRPFVHDPRAHEGVVLRVQGDEAVGDLDVLQRAAQELRRRQRLAVVAEAHGAGLRQLVHLGELLAGQVPAHGGEEARRHARLGAGPLREPLEHRRRVDHRVGVGHREEGHVATGRGRRRAADEVLLVLAPRRAQVRVQVDEARHEQAAGAVDRPGPLGASRFSPTAAILPFLIRTSQTSSSLACGSTTRAPRTTRSAPAPPFDQTRTLMPHPFRSPTVRRSRRWCGRGSPCAPPGRSRPARG